ncbi:alcohol dehydrogenase catalytic domain-containing protein [Streptomyces sp. 6N223]|uniref:alcohol dehydrogenase catalytic domain-containing protein n=1 Tax=Streptomyces sp. 6N223 TaxID=3457412 RepID=UPI003FD1DCFA
MKALVFYGPGQPVWEDVADPRLLEPGDAIVRVDATTICGTDLRILRGDLPKVAPGTVLGHEAVGSVVEAGPEVRAVRPGDRVVVSCVSACGRCRYCRRGAYGQCAGGGGWLLGRLINGTQAEYVRVPFADTSTHRLPGGGEALADADAVLLADVLPTAYEVGVLGGRVTPGDTVVVVGAGPVGLAAVATARLFSPRRIVVLDPAADRLEVARALGADIIGDPGEQPEALVGDLTGGAGAEVVIEAAGRPETFELCTRLVGPGGRLANTGVHNAPATLPLQELWSKNVTITTGLVDTRTTPTLLSLLAAGRLSPSALVTHDFPLEEVATAYRVVAAPAETGALKVVLAAGPAEERSLVRTAAAA